MHRIGLGQILHPVFLPKSPIKLTVAIKAGKPHRGQESEPQVLNILQQQYLIRFYHRGTIQHRKGQPVQGFAVIAVGDSLQRAAWGSRGVVPTCTGKAQQFTCKRAASQSRGDLAKLVAHRPVHQQAQVTGDHTEGAIDLMHARRLGPGALNAGHHRRQGVVSHHSDESGDRHGDQHFDQGKARSLTIRAWQRAAPVTKRRSG